MLNKANLATEMQKKADEIAKKTAEEGVIPSPQLTINGMYHLFPCGDYDELWNAAHIAYLKHRGF